MNLSRFIGKCLSGWYIIHSKIYPSFSQAGEDQLLRHLFERLNISNPSYLDIGTNHPFIGNNTYFFYIRGAVGVCVEPDMGFYKLIKKHRPKDIVLQAGVGINQITEADLFIFPYPYSGWNTFSATEAKKREQETGISISRVQKVSLLNINDIMKKYFHPHPNLLSIDVEGHDLEILQNLDFGLYRPEVICAETITFSMQNKEVKIKDMIDYIESKGYFVFGDTHINSIFCRNDIYKTSLG